MNSAGRQSSSIQLVAHRGDAARFPENTREAVGAAVDAGATFVEFDIQLSADRVPFLLHDESFMRTGGVDTRIFDINATQVADICVGESNRFGSAYSALRAPRLADIIDDLTRWESVTAFVELKRQSISHFGLEAVLDAVLPVLQPVLDRCVIISFDPEAVREARARSNCRIGLVLREWDADNHKLATTLAPDFLFCNVSRLPQAPEPLWQGSWAWGVYEITDPGQALELAARGVDLVETMAYTELAAGLTKRSGKVSRNSYDVVVVGGGINGVGVAQAAAAAGYSVLLLEQRALAAGTSSKSSKLIHGGLRYLESLEFGLVRESLYERKLLLKLAPELVKLQAFCVPLYKKTRRKPWQLGAGLSLYYLLSKFDADAQFGTVPRPQWDQLDGLRTDKLRSVFRYMDARTDDALLTEAVMGSARSLGAELACPAEFCGAQLQAKGCHVQYRVDGVESTCDAGVLINAAGPWVNDVVSLITPEPEKIPVELVRGAHVLVPGAIANMSGKFFYYVESRRDGRAIFIMPRNGELLIGTTETTYRGKPGKVQAVPSEETYLLRVLRYYFPKVGKLNRSHLSGSFAGLRVLPTGAGHAFHRSRETILQSDRPDRPRVLSIYGGKLTSYRATAEKVIERVRSSLPGRTPVGSTRELPLEPD